MTNRNTRAQQLFLKGRDISMWVEAGIIGFLPLILFILELISAYAEASLVQQVMPYFEDSFIKAVIYTGAGMGAGIFFAPNFSWMIQCSRYIKKLQSKTLLSKEFRYATVVNLKAAQKRFGLTALFTFAVALISHGITLYFMEVAFNNRKTLELLDISNMGEVPYTLAISVSIMGFALDVLLGLTTSTQINLEDYYPSDDTDKSLLEYSQKYAEALQKEAAYYEKKIEKQSQLDEFFENHSEKKNDIVKMLTTDKGIPIWEERASDVFFSTIFKRDGISIGNLNKAIKDLGLVKFENNFATPLAESFANLQNLYKEKYNRLKNRDKNEVNRIKDEISSLKLETLDLFRKMGLTPKERNKKKYK